MSDTKFQELERLYLAAVGKPKFIICDARSEIGQFILVNRDGEDVFDGFVHAYIERNGQIALVPLKEIE